MSSEFSEVRKSMGRIYESGKRADLSTTGQYSASFIKPCNIKSIIDLVSLLPINDDAAPMSVTQQLDVASRLARAIIAKDMHGQFISTVRLISEFFESKSVDEFTLEKLPALCSTKRMRGYESEVMAYAKAMVPLYSEGQVIKPSKYKELVKEALKLVKKLECCTKDREMERLIISEQSLGIMILSTCLFDINSNFKYPILKKLDYDVRGTSLLFKSDGTLFLTSGEIKSADPTPNSLRKSMCQLFIRLYILAFAADCTGLSIQGKCQGHLYSSFTSDKNEAKALLFIKNNEEKLLKARKDFLPNYSFHIDI